ncbi:MAG: Flp pilus assembly protein CpaB [Minwuiales bacterium]|nr:Flp pilus assembly protein CpaB [Minwuiales bacterium]
MNPRTIILVVAALLITGGTIILAQSWLESQRRQVAAPVEKKEQLTMVLVAGLDLPTGVFLNQEHIRWQAWPNKEVPETYYVKSQTDIQDLMGAVVRRGITAGEPLTKGRLVKPGERGFVAAVLRPGHRAISVPINVKTGVAGHVSPGDRVDLILNRAIAEKGEEETIQRRVSETVLTNVRVLAIDQRLNDQDGRPRQGKTATLEVTPKLVEFVSVVQQLGDMSLSLRSLAKNESELGVLARSGEVLDDPDPKRGTTYTFDSQVSRVGTQRTKSNRNRVLVTRGSETKSVSFQ